MSLFFASPRPGDWVSANRVIRTSVTDHLLGGDAGIRPGTRGVVVRALGWNSVEVQFETGLFGSVRTHVTPSQVRVVRRAGGVDAFERTAGRLNAARLGVALAFIGPIAYFVVSWFVGGGTKDGLVVVVLEGCVYGALDLLAYLLGNPVEAIVYLVVLTVAGRFAFRA